MAWTMKDSGIEWIGQIPSDKETIRLKYIADITTGNMDTQNKNDEGIYPFYVRSPIVEHSDDYSFDDTEAILMAGDGVGAGRVFHLVSGKYGCHQRVYRLNNFKGVSARFLKYYLEVVFPMIMDYGSAKSTVDSVRLPMIQGVDVVMFDIEEQQKIIKFLDDKVSEIEMIISKTKQTIEDYKKYRQAVITEAVTKGLDDTAPMKNSRIKGIGTVKEKYTILKLKYLFGHGDDGLKVGPFGSAMKGKTLDSGVYKIYNQAHLISGDFSLKRHYISEEAFDELKSYEVKKGDVLFSMMGTIGKCRIMPEGFPKGIMDSHLLKARLNNKVLPRYFEYVYDKDNSNVIISQMLEVANGSIMNGLNSTIVKNLYMPVPELSEQEEILEYLDSKCQEIDSLIVKKEVFVEEMETYKRSLIYEYVTGKKEVV